MGDIIYEGARGITPTYLGFLGASALLVGLIFSLGEFISIALRLVSGVLVDITRSYWLFFFLGYGLIISIPLIGFFNTWIVVAILILVERFAKALRTPARDTLLSIASKGVGTGKAFGLHELLDQVGAVTGPLFLGLILLWSGNNYGLAYTTLFIPYIILVLFVISVYFILGSRTREMVEKVKKVSVKASFSELPTSFKIYSLAVALNTLGLIHWSLILYQTSEYVYAWISAFLYVLIQLVDAVAAPFSGYLYDRYGLKILIIPFIISVFPTLFGLLGGWIYLIISGIFYGFVYGMQQSIYRAAVSDLVSIEYRGTAYGIFNTLYGVGLLLSGVIYGYFISYNILSIGIVFSIVLEVVATLILYKAISLFTSR